MEILGVPAVVICTEPFVGSGKAMAASHGIPDYPFVTIPHPIAATETKTLEEWADQVTGQVASMLLKGGAASPTTGQ